MAFFTDQFLVHHFRPSFAKTTLLRISCLAEWGIVQAQNQCVNQNWYLMVPNNIWKRHFWRKMQHQLQIKKSRVICCMRVLNLYDVTCMFDLHAHTCTRTMYVRVFI